MDIMDMAAVMETAGETKEPNNISVLLLRKVIPIFLLLCYPTNVRSALSLDNTG